MNKTKEFERIIEDDIAKCEQEIKEGNKLSRNELHNRLVSKYGNIIDGFKEELFNLFYDDSGRKCLCNLETMKEKLILFKSMGYENIYSQSMGENHLTINNTNKIEVDINITFSKAREQVENMTSLNNDEIQDIISKIDQLEEIVNSNDRKTKKWDNAKGIIKWIADKGVDVGLTLLPLLLKLGEV